jgi:hypothetical protein
MREEARPITASLYHHCVVNKYYHGYDDVHERI